MRTSPDASTFHYPQVEILYEDGARSFLFLTVPPTNRAPLIIEQGSEAVALITSALADYNAQLAANVRTGTTEEDMGSGGSGGKGDSAVSCTSHPVIVATRFVTVVKDALQKAEELGEYNKDLKAA